ncbi:hypothetical protein GW17_00006936 [Ensete ventricosum]|nr:hypothetical protein GW17_00006936 [Ensete ventricosum]
MEEKYQALELLQSEKMIMKTNLGVPNLTAWRKCKDIDPIKCDLLDDVALRESIEDEDEGVGTGKAERRGGGVLQHHSGGCLDAEAQLSTGRRHWRRREGDRGAAGEREWVGGSRGEVELGGSERRSVETPSCEERGGEYGAAAAAAPNRHPHPLLLRTEILLCRFGRRERDEAVDTVRRSD